MRARQILRRSRISLAREEVLIARRVILDSTKLVYVLLADRKLRYPRGRSRIVYIGTTKNGGSRIAQSVAARAPEILMLRGVASMTARVIVCRPRQRIRMWRRLENAFRLGFRERFGAIPRCNKRGHQIKATSEWSLFARKRVTQVLDDLS